MSPFFFVRTPLNTSDAIFSARRRSGKEAERVREQKMPRHRHTVRQCRSGENFFYILDVYM